MDTKVLVVEDDLEINELLGEYLDLEKIRYLQATTGQAGIHLAGTQHPDAIILDLMLPDIDGFEVARTLSTHRATYDIPIIILSCMCQDCDREKGYASGALFFMNKPFLPDDLIATVRQALDWKAGLRDRTPAGDFTLGCPSAEAATRCKSINQMVADLFAHTDLPDPVIAQIRDTMEILNTWASQWNTDHKSRSRLKVEYHIQLRNNAASAPPASIEWKLSEETPGLLADAFFKLPPSGTIAGGGLIGWGANTLSAKTLAPLNPPVQWLQILTKTGAHQFEKDAKSQTVRFSRSLINGNSASPPSNSSPTRLRSEPLAGNHK